MIPRIIKGKTCSLRGIILSGSLILNNRKIKGRAKRKRKKVNVRGSKTCTAIFPAIKAPAQNKAAITIDI